MSYLIGPFINWNANPTSNLSPNDLCRICGKKPKYIEKGFKHPYCGRTCARRGQMLFPRAAGRTAKVTDFYSNTHGRDAFRPVQVAGCERCKVHPRSVGTLCATCDPRARASSLPKLRQLKPDGSTAFKNLRTQFRSEWEVFPTLPTIEKVYEIHYGPDIRKNYENHQNDHPDKVFIRTFHASQCICDMGTKGASLCHFKSCGICSIVKSSFGEFAFGERYNVGRFGKGIYAYRDPSLADRHATSCTSSPYRVMIACDTLVDQDQLDGVDDSESIFIDCIDAIHPAYIIMYCKQQCSTSRPDSRSQRSRRRSHIKSVKVHNEGQTFLGDTSLASESSDRLN